MDDKYVLEMLQACGKANSWRRAFDSDDRPLSFGFCEFKGVKSVVCAMNVLPAVVWAGQSESPTITVDRSIEWVLDSCQSLDTDKTMEKAALSAVKRIIQESSVTTVVDKDEQPADRASTEAGANMSSVSGDSAGHVLDRSAELNLDNLSITKETARCDVASVVDGRQPETLEQQKQPFALGVEEEWEREQARSHRVRQYIISASEREDSLSKEQYERECRAEHAALRELDRVEERQRARDLMSDMLSKWDDDEEERLREHEYYRDRERWWHRRKAVRARELELDAIDRQDQELSRNEKPPSPHPGAVESADGTCVVGDDILENKAAPVPSAGAGASSANVLLAQSIKWDCVDESLLRAKVEPTARSLLQEYIGGDADQEVADLAEFVIGHIRDHKSPQSLVEELEMVLVEEAREFVGKLWSILPTV
ncbi:hypothetical protein GGI20_001190 [Coemansia sp. BCRC 34301]|nr:hypothetical protein GGI20_001190 [Coemansia sp. BCRC 34301]